MSRGIDPSGLLRSGGCGLMMPLAEYGTAQRRCMMTTYTLSIGRNLGSEWDDGELTSGEWRNFALETESALASEGVTLFFTGFGVGWFEGKSESSWTAVFTLDNDSNLDSLVGRLAKLARDYCQDSIALTSGNTHFVSMR